MKNKDGLQCVFTEDRFRYIVRRRAYNIVGRPVKEITCKARLWRAGRRRSWAQARLWPRGHFGSWAEARLWPRGHFESWAEARLWPRDHFGSWAKARLWQRGPPGSWAEARLWREQVAKARTGQERFTFGLAQDPVITMVCISIYPKGGPCR